MSAFSSSGKGAFAKAQYVIVSRLHRNCTSSSAAALHGIISSNKIWRTYPPGLESPMVLPHSMLLGSRNTTTTTTHISSVGQYSFQRAYFASKNDIQKSYCSSVLSDADQEGVEEISSETISSQSLSEDAGVERKSEGVKMESVMKQLRGRDIIGDEVAINRALHNMNLNVQRTGRALLRDVMAIFNSMQRLGHCTPNDALVLLRCCGELLPDETSKTRAEASEKLWSFYQDMGISLDTSHYNALLKNRLDNSAPDFQPSEFLAMMEADGVEANRVTFQHLIAKFCSLGDIPGATTILEHMKEQKMSVNENVFHSLIIGHCRAKDFENAKGVMKIMTESGADVDSDTRMTYIVELAKAGKDFKKELAEANEEDIKFTDHDYFTLILALLQKGEKEAAAEIVEMLPKKRGFFQEMRNFIPAMIFAGEIDLPFKILETFRTPAHVGSEGHADVASADHGMFFLRAMVQNEYDPESVIEYIKKFQGAEAAQHSSRILEICVEFRKVTYGQSVYDEIIKEFGGEALQPNHISTFVRGHVNRLKSNMTDGSVELIQLLVNMGAIGLRPLTSDLSQSIFPNLLQKEQLPGSVTKQIKDAMDEAKDAGIEMKSPIPWYQISNAMLQFLLNQETQNDLSRAIGFLLNIDMPKRPHLWNSSLARSFLATNSVESLVTMLGICSSMCNKHMKKEASSYNTEELMAKGDEDLFQSLNHIIALIPRYRPNATPQEVLLPVLNGLLDAKIGVPGTITSRLKRSMEDCDSDSDALIEVIDKLEVMYKAERDYWTEEAVEKFMEARKQINNYNISKKSPNFIPMNKNGFIPMDSFPTDLNELERAYNLLQQKGNFNLVLTNKLVSRYAKNNMFDDADAVIDSAPKAEEMKILPSTVDDYFVACSINNQFERAINFLEKAVKFQDTQIYASSCVTLAIAMAEQGEHENVLKFLNLVDKDRIFSKKFSIQSEMSQIVKYYRENQDTYNMSNAVYAVLKDKGLSGLINTSASVSLGKLIGDKVKIGKHIGKGDLVAAVEEFERIAKEERKVPYKFYLMDKLIANDDMENIQRVLDASVNAIGEVKTLYDMVWNFLYAGKISQARKLLETPGLKYDEDKASWIMHQLARNNKIDELEHFVALSQPLFACNRDFMYSTLVSALEQAKETGRIYDVWVNMQEEGYTPSEKLKIKMANALQAQGYVVPYDIPKSAAIIDTIPTEGSTRETSNEAYTVPYDVPNVKKEPGRKTDATSKDGINKGGKKSGSFDVPLRSALMRKDGDEIMERFKSLAETGELENYEFPKVLNFLIEAEDTDLKLNALLEILQTGILTTANIQDNHGKFLQLIDAFDREQFEIIEKATLGMPYFRLKFMIDGRKVHQQIEKDVESYMRELETSDGSGFMPKVSIMRKLIQANSENVERLFETARRVSSKLPEFPWETAKACLIEGHSDVANRLWQLEKLDQLPASSFKNLGNLTSHDLMPIKEFLLSVLSYDDSNDVNKPVDVNHAKILAKLYNAMIANSILDLTKTKENPEDILNDAFSKGISLHSLSNTNLKGIQELPEISTVIKAEASNILSERKEWSRRLREEHKKL